MTKQKIVELQGLIEKNIKHVLEIKPEDNVPSRSHRRISRAAADYLEAWLRLDNLFGRVPDNGRF